MMLNGLKLLMIAKMKQEQLLKHAEIKNKNGQIICLKMIQHCWVLMQIC